MIIEILIAQRHAEHALPDLLPHAVLNGLRIAVIDKLFGQPCDDPRSGLDLAENKPAAVGANHAPIEFAHHCAPAQCVKFQWFGVTLCHRRAALLFGYN